MVSILLYHRTTYSQKEKFPLFTRPDGLIDKNPCRNATQLLHHYHHHSFHNFSIHPADGGGLQGLASTWRIHGKHFLTDDQTIFDLVKIMRVTMMVVMMMLEMMIMIQGVTLMKQTGLLCFADEPQNPFVTSVLASFQQAITIITKIEVLIVIRHLYRRMWSTQFTKGSSSKKAFHISPLMIRWWSINQSINQSINHQSIHQALCISTSINGWWSIILPLESACWLVFNWNILYWKCSHQLNGCDVKNK